MSLKRWLAQVPAIANWMSQRDQIVLQQAMQQELAYGQRVPNALVNFEQRFFSQNGEDGIIQEILRRIGVTNRYFVEFGCETGVETCCRYLLETCEWRGLWIEGNEASAQLARSRFASLLVQILNRFLTKENILPIFAEAGVPEEFDLLVIDIDGNDYWLWQTISTRYSPRIVVIEYNPAFTPGEHWVMPYNPTHRWQRDWYSGASLKALARLAAQLAARLARKRGYELVACDSNGVNAFFVRRDLLSDKFSDAGNLRLLHRTYKYNPFWYGHAPSEHHHVVRHKMNPIDLSVIEHLHISWAQPPDKFRIKVGSVWYLSLELDNQSDTELMSTPPHPVLLSYHWINAEQVAREGIRTRLAPTSKPNTRQRYLVRVYAPPEPGQYTLRLALLQEYVLWFFEANANCAVTVSVEVVL
jgi:hypothetical protein